MKPCAQCQQQNQDDSKFCYQCGSKLAAEPEPPVAAPRAQPDIQSDIQPDEHLHPEEHVWRQFIGPYADRYLKHFKKFGLGDQPKFAMTWNWPAFLYVSFLWFLYRKMYTYAAVYAVGPMISTYLTGDMTVGLIWSIMAGATANYVYYWHCREHIGEIKRSLGTNPAKQDEALKESGGVQSYVIWIGVAVYLLFAVTMFKMVQDGPPDEELSPGRPARQVSASRV